MNDNQPSWTRMSAAHSRGPKGTEQAHESSLLALGEAVRCWPLPETERRAPDTTVLSVATAPRLSHDFSAAPLLWCSSSRIPPAGSGRKNLGEELILKVFVVDFVTWGSKVCHCECSLHHAQQIKANRQ